MTLPMSSRVAQRFLSTSGIAGLALLAVACVIQLPPTPTPKPLVPTVATQAPPESGQSRLVVDVVDGPTPVQRVLMQSEPIGDAEGRVSYRFYESYEPLCDASPCVLDVPSGNNVLLAFPVVGNRNAIEVELVHVDNQPSVYRRSLSRYDGKRGALHVLGIIATSLGGSAAITGVALLPVGLGDDNDDLALAGGITLVAGAVLTTLGVWAIRRDSPSYRPGSSLHFLQPSP
jgi:hypothetical protein